MAFICIGWGADRVCNMGGVHGRCQYWNNGRSSTQPPFCFSLFFARFVCMQARRYITGHYLLCLLMDDRIGYRLYTAGIL